MLEALSVIGGVSTAGALIAVIILAFKLSSSKDETLSAHDRIAEAGHYNDAMTAERDRLARDGDTKAAQIAELERRLTAAEDARAQAAADAVRSTIERVKAAGVADAAQIVNSILSTPLSRGKK